MNFALYGKFTRLSSAFFNSWINLEPMLPVVNIQFLKNHVTLLTAFHINIYVLFCDKIDLIIGLNNITVRG